ncbi:carbohydrate ABC transporter substrate-binding protein [Pleurocapsales cyanobacterium LEGE 06147]|nr:carbohydrate ABC transporter substrate-binding protein [Pleurocapsales cyanobacterium LEGE 06147]
MKINKLSQSSLLFLIIAILVACTNFNNSEQLTSESNSTQTTPSSQENKTLEIWWDKGYIAEEDEILQQIVDDWQQNTGNKAEIFFYSADEITQKTNRAIQAGNPPDLLFSSRAEYPLLAWQGKLIDVSDVIKPVEKFYSSTAKQAAYLYNNVEKKRSYYAVPLHQATIHIFYWKDLLKKAGKNSEDIPQKWDEFWEFWRKLPIKFQNNGKTNIYSLGLPISVGASDTYYLFEQILEAYDVSILDSRGQLIVDNPKVRQGIVNCLEWYAKFYQQGYVPPTATRWLDPDNNRSFLNRTVVMTPNPTLSIATALRKDPETYTNKLGMLEFPTKPNGKPMRHIVAVRQVVILAEAQNQKIAKNFLAYLIQPEVIGNYLKSSGGRYLPVITPAKQDSFWTQPTDLPVSTATKTLTQGQTRLFYSVQNPIYSSVLAENIWGKALNRIVTDNISANQAADEAIARIKAIFRKGQ